MTEDPDLTAVIEAWPNLAPDARRMLSRLAHDCMDPANAGAFRKPADAGHPEKVELEPQAWPELTSSRAWERHDDPELS